MGLRVAFVCLFSEQALFSVHKNFVFRWMAYNSDKLELSDFRQIWSVQTLISLQQKRVGEFDNSKNYFEKPFLWGRSVAVS